MIDRRVIWLVQTKFNMSGQRAMCLLSDCWREENISRKALWFLSVAVSKLGKTDLVFLQPGVYYCENVLEQSLLPPIRRISNNDIVFQQEGASAQCTPFTLHCRLHAFQCAWVHCSRKLAAEQSVSKSRGLFSVDSVVADGVVSWHWSAEASFDRLLGLAKPGHIEPNNNWSAAKKTAWRWLSRQRVIMLNFVWTNHVLHIVIVLIYFEWKWSKTHA